MLQCELLARESEVSTVAKKYGIQVGTGLKLGMKGFAMMVYKDGGSELRDWFGTDSLAMAMVSGIFLLFTVGYAPLIPPAGMRSFCKFLANFKLKHVL